MKQAIVNYLKVNAGRHVLGIAVAASVVLAGGSWLKEHDARLTAEVQVQSLQQQKDAITKAAQEKVIVLREAATRVKTPEQAVQALPSVELPERPLNAIPEPGGRVGVDAVPLYQTLNSSAQDKVNLDACNKKLGVTEQQVKTLQKKPSFWKRVGHVSKVVACSGAAGAVGAMGAGIKGAAIGGALGAGACQIL